MKLLFENPNLSINEARLLSAEVFLGGIDTVKGKIQKLCSLNVLKYKQVMLRRLECNS